MPIRKHAVRAFLAVNFLAACAAAASGPGHYLSSTEFLSGAFPDGEPRPDVIWVDNALRRDIEDVLGHRFDGLRIRYWQLGNRTAWIFDEIGKELPITIGVAVLGNAVESVRVLEFRETRGWEVRYPFFTDQFSGASLDDRDQIDGPIDGITGATLSVAAVTRVVKLALFLSSKTKSPHS